MSSRLQQHRQGRATRALLAVPLLLVLAGCITDTLTVPPTEPARVELPASPPRPAGPAGSALKEHQRLVAAFGGEYRAPGAQALLNEVVERLRLVSDKPNERYRVTILNSPVVNAFALPSGNVYVTRGLLVLANDTAEMASVLAHEIAHVTSRHAVERQELESRSVLVSRVNAEVLNDPATSRLARDQSRVALASFSRQQEIEADRIGVRTIAMAGYDPYGAGRFLVSLDRTTALRSMLLGQNNTREGLDFLSTHPTTPERISASVATARQFNAPGVGEADRARWLKAVSGMIFGEDQSDGFVRGRTFLHPKLGFTFDAPAGYVLENTSQAVLGILPNAGEALRLDSARLASDRSLEDFLKENPIEGLPFDSLEPVDLRGTPAVTATARGAEWSFRVYVARLGGAAYRLIFATRTLGPEQEQRFRQSAESFRPLSNGEAARATPLRVALVTARAGDTAESLSRSMEFLDQPQQRFLILNGLAAEAGITPGQTYKIITE